MLSEKQISEIREHLEKAQNPVMFFDNDCDGLMSFVMLRKFIGRGKGVAVKSSFEEIYAKRVDELNADYVFILDKPEVSLEFVERVTEKGIPIVWIDHHDVPYNIKNDLVFYYNPIYNKNKSNEPVSYLVYQIVKRNDFQWLSMIGCIADNFVPGFKDEFAREFPELWKRNFDGAFDVLYSTEIGTIIKMLDFALKDRTSNVVAMLNFLVKINSPFEILKEDSRNLMIHKRYQEVNSVYSRLFEKARWIARKADKVIFFEYGGDLSLSSNLSNELSYRFPGKVVIVAYVKGANANVSVRGPINVRKIGLEAFKKIESASGGGHERAIGARMNVEDLPRFRDFYEERV
ncbi:hypothetical protein CMI46_01685 [Candidatus Pacearchaeota archaeon]|nr:hypothetical protein [Candidatus Pacearchaeota archaeon]|tara:strand:- start:4494 stop:5534 length:1041 start_codon:yes stop_codon:yes gene_type:complete